VDALRELVGRALERGAIDDAAPLLAPAARLAEAAWSRLAAPRVARPIALPRGARVVGVGGATLGGAGKSPVAVAIARELAVRGDRVALVVHAYRAAPGRARVVGGDDDARAVGDDALAAARQLAHLGVAVVVAPSRQRSIDAAAAQGARTIVVDGLLQASPRRLDAAVLVLDAEAPWGAGACPPRGDLRAPTATLLAAADRVAAVLDAGAAPHASLPERALRLASDVAGAHDASARFHPLASLGGARLGLVLAIAHPERVERALARRGVAPAARVILGDHARLGPDAIPDARVDAWLTTARCATKLPATLGAAPVLALDHRVDASELARALA
jgi:tetraacyldisaccharide 4'-kinase